MEFNGRIMRVLPVQSGTNANGNAWTKQEFIFEYFEHDTDRYSDKVCLNIMNDKIAEYDLHENDEVLIGFGHSIREYQGKYYNEVRMYKLQKKGQPANQPNSVEQPKSADPNIAQQGTMTSEFGKLLEKKSVQVYPPAEAPVTPQQPTTAEQEKDDLPF